MDHLTKYHLIMIQNSFSFNLSKPSKGLAPSLGKSCLQIRRVGLQASNPLGGVKMHAMKAAPVARHEIFYLYFIVHVCYPSCQSTGQRWLPGLQRVKKLRTSVQVDTYVDTLRIFSKKKQSASKMLLVNLYNFTFPPCLLKHPKS